MEPGHAPRLPGDRYRLIERTGIGRLTEAWTGRDDRLERDVVVRVVRQDLSSDIQLVERLSTRLKEAARLDVTNLAKIYDMIDGAVVAVVTEPTIGPDLRQRINDEGPFSAAETLAIAGQIAVFIDELHDRGTTHGGLTAASVGWGTEERLIITDLGTGGDADADADETVTGDITALAAIVHEMATGRPPHRSGGGLENDPSVPTAFAGPLHDAFDARRFTSARALVEALGTTRSLAAAPATFSDTERRWLVPMAIVIVIGLFLALVGAVLGRTDTGRSLFESARDVVGLDPPTATTPPTTTDSSDVPPLTTTTTQPVAQLEILQIVDFDPQGDDGAESPNRLPLINNGDPTRGWQTERYTTQEFGNLKGGVGLLVDLASAAELTSLTVRSPSRGWAMEVYTAPMVAALVDDWGDARLASSDINGDAAFDDIALADPTRGILLWFTRLDERPEHRVVVTDIEVEGRPIA